MVSLQSSALLPEARRVRPPCLPLVDAVVASTATSKKRKRDGADVDDGDVNGGADVGIELSFDAAPLPLEWQRCLDIKSGQIHYYNTRTHRRTSRDPRAEAPAPELHHRAAAAAAAEEEEEAANYSTPPPGLDLELNLTFEPRRVPVQEKKQRPSSAEAKKPAAAVAEERLPFEVPAAGPSREMIAAVCTRCHMLVMMCREWPACPNCKFMHPTTTNRPGSPPPDPEPAPLKLKLGLQLLCCKD
ncbi:hypothetical protein GUJ93_ZPchr0006g45744 [Zizania palustris]|uniref:WW domain-containing protein n=1 Tax=Zizania palustris TaxID=103762 RepID=A0A8J5T534_ZIZPA|nr:hypothetical protein GUJ93_ZPchr0006g45744 [Zizania palustris]